MKSLNIEAIPDSPYYPEVSFDVETGICVLRGESYMEEAYKFYMPLLDWLKQYAVEEKHTVTLEIKLTYFNTNSSRLLLDMFDILKKAEDHGTKVKIKWYYEADDPDIQDEVEDFEIETGLKFEMVPMED